MHELLFTQELKPTSSKGLELEFVYEVTFKIKPLRA